ncbi:MAG: glycosyl hydrolase, partial [Thermoanaerobaculia bacterium]
SPARLYYGSQRLWRSDDRGDSWRPVSGDLTRGRNRYELELMGRVWSVDDLYDNTAMSWYGTLTAVAESPLVEGLLYAGSDDGLVQMSEDGGDSWQRIEIPGVPELAFVNDLMASLHDPDTVYAVFDNHKQGDFSPYVYRSDDRGRSWRSVAGDLPERHVLWSIVQDHERPGLLFAGSEYGIHFTLDGGGRWLKLAGGPTIAFRDLAIQRRESDLIGASFGRGFWVLDDYSPLRSLSEEALAQEALLFAPRDALWYAPANTMATRGKAYQGGAYFAAPNPPHGAVFTYHLRDSAETARERRRAHDKELRETGEDVQFPGWEVLRDEELESEPRVVLTVRAADGAVVRRLDGAAGAGIHRVTWDLHYPPVDPIEIEPPGELPPWARPPRGPLAVPGRYTVELARFDGDRLTPLGDPQGFSIRTLDNQSLPAAEPGEALAFARNTADLHRRLQGAAAELDSAGERIEYLERALFATPAAPTELLARLRAAEREIAELEVELTGDAVRRRLREPTTPSILDRVGSVARGHWDNRGGPTATHRRELEVAAEAFDRLAPRLRELLEAELPAIEVALEEAGAPWTPGRRLP